MEEQEEDWRGRRFRRDGCWETKRSDTKEEDVEEETKRTRVSPPTIRRSIHPRSTSPGAARSNGDEIRRRSESVSMAGGVSTSIGSMALLLMFTAATAAVAAAVVVIGGFEGGGGGGG